MADGLHIEQESKVIWRKTASPVANHRRTSRLQQFEFTLYVLSPLAAMNAFVRHPEACLLIQPTHIISIRWAGTSLPQKFPFPYPFPPVSIWGVCAHLIHCSLGSHESVPETAPHLGWFSRLCTDYIRVPTQTKGHTDRTSEICSNRPRLGTACGRCGLKNEKMRHVCTSY